MNRSVVVIVAVAALLLGLLVGYLWWGSSLQRVESELRAARESAQGAQREAEQARARTGAVEAELKAVQERLKDLETRLASEQQHRTRLEALLSKGRK